MKNCLVLIVIFTFACSLNAQSEAGIRGVVVANADNSLLPATAIRLESPLLAVPFQTTTGPDGRFAFLRLIPGDYVVVAARTGFQEERVNVRLGSREIETITLKLSLQPVTATVQVTAAAESAGSTILDTETIEALPIAQRNDLPDVIAMSAPGMIRSHDDFVHIRGNEIAVNTFINGVSFWENPHSVLSAGLSPDVIQSANIMTGGFPAEFGNRFGGVVDIVTKSGFSTNNHGSLTVGAGNALRHNVAIEHGGSSGKAAYYFNTSAFESARYLSPNDPRSIHDTGRGVRSFLQLDFDLNPGNSLKVVLAGDGTNFQIPNTNVDERLRPGLGASQRARQQTAILTWNRDVSGVTGFSTSFYQRWSSVKLLPTSNPLASVAVNERTLRTTGLKSDLTRFAGRHTIKAGIDAVLLQPDEHLFFYGEGYVAFSHLAGLHHVHLRGPDRGPIAFTGRKTGGQISGYIQDSLQATPNLTVEAGLRYDGYSLADSDFAFSPRLKTTYRFPRSGTAISASYDHFFVPPAVENVLISSAGLTRFLQDHPVALPPLRPIKEDQVEIDANQSFKQKIVVGLTGYFRTSKDPVHTVLFPDSRIYTYANFDKGKAYGMELKIETPALEQYGLTSHLNYALSRVYFWNPVVAGFVDEDHHLDNSERFLAPMDQKHTLNAGFTYRHRRSGLWTGMSLEYGSGTPIEVEDGTEGPERVPAHATGNLSVGFDVLRTGERRAELQFNIENLTNNVYVVSQESAFSPGEYFNPRFFSGSLKVHF